MKTPRYILVEPDNLLSVCIDILQRCENRLDLVLNGTLPTRERKQFLERINVQYAGFEAHPAHLESWSEYFTLAVAAKYYDFHYRHTKIITDDGKMPVRYKAAIGIEERFIHDSNTRELLLGDGFLFNTTLKAGIIVQECKAQNIRGRNAGKRLEDEAIRIVKAKVAKRKRYVDDCALLVTVIPRKGAGFNANHVSFKNILQACPEVTAYEPVLFMLYEPDFRDITVVRFDPTLDTPESFRNACLNIKIAIASSSN